MTPKARKILVADLSHRLRELGVGEHFKEMPQSIRLAFMSGKGFLAIVNRPHTLYIHVIEGRYTQEQYSKV